MSNVPAIKIGNHLIEAYKGHYEDDYEFQAQCKKALGLDVITSDQYDVWLTEKVRQLIVENTPKERLELYCEWNGILGYSNTLFDIATGKL